MSAEQGAQGDVENPVLAGFRSIIMLIGELAKKGDPRAEPAKQALQGLLSSLSGGDLPMEPPMGAQPGQAGAPQPGMGAPPMPGAEPPMPGAEPPMPEMIGNPFEAPEPTQGPKARPMGAPKAPMKAGVKQPTILT